MEKSHGSDSDEESPQQTTPPSKSKKKAEPKGKKTPEKKSYRCDRCNFSSSSKAKYTKHAKSAHSGTIVQCDHCEFKTPYKWNLDRHYKNHLGGGALCCHICNFSCDIKQSLTVHLQNHHSNVPEEIIESVKRQQIPPRNQSINNINNNNNSVASANSTTPATAASSSLPTINNNSVSTAAAATKTSNTNAISTDTIKRSDSPGIGSDGEKKVPPLRISRTVTGLSLGEENNSNDESTSTPSSSNKDGAAGNGLGIDQEKRKCDLCDFETSVDGSVSGISSAMKKHLASQHGIHSHKKHHHHHSKKESRARSSSPEHNMNTKPLSPSTITATSSSPTNIPVVPIPLPPKKSKGSTSPRPGQPASSSSNSPAVHRSQSPMKASEAINAFGSSGDHKSGLQAMAPSEEEYHHHPQTILNLSQSSSLASTQLQSAGEESAFTPVMSGNGPGGAADYTHTQISSLKKPKQRALAQFYQKIKPKFTSGLELEGELSSSTVEAPAATIGECPIKEEPTMEDPQKSGSASSKSNRCQYCRQRCKSTTDLATHLEKCLEAGKKEGENYSKIPNSKGEVADGDQKPSILNGSGGELNDGLIGFETAPGVGAIHTGKLEEMEYQGYNAESESQNEDDGESGGTRTNSAMDDHDDLDEELEEDGGSGKKSGKGGKAQITNRKVYRCPENDCSFWATTASRFHVHIVGHYNLKPFECSECHYKSNWRWDVNKHIRLKTPKDPKHAVAKTLLTHESGQRDYRKYDNYLINMSLTHSANAKAPECSTVATKRTKTPKSSPELQSTSLPKQSPTGSCSSASSTPLVPVSPPERKSKSSKGSKGVSSSTPFTASVAGPGESSPPSYSGNSAQTHSHLKQEDINLYPVDMASSSDSQNEGRTFVETRMLAGGEIYTSMLKQDPSSGTTNISERDQEERDDVPPSGFDLTLKRPRSRHRAPHQVSVEEMQQHQFHDMQTKNLAMPIIPTKKSRLQEQQQENQQKHTTGSVSCGATNGGGNKIMSMWQCIKCNFKHMHKDVVSSHIRDQHKPKKGDPVSLLTHNHLIQVVVPEQDADVLMASSTSGDLMDYSEKTLIEQKREIFREMYNENGKVLSCKFCPFTTGLLYEIEIHAEHHLSKSNNYFSCPHCSYSVAVKSELHEHLKLHGDIMPQELEIQNKLINSSTVLRDSSRMYLSSPSNVSENLCTKPEVKQRHCVDCPFITTDISEFQYHRQCHEPSNYPFKCHKCSFSVSVKLHLLQHLRVHGIQIDEVGVPTNVQTPDFPQYSTTTLNQDYESISDDGYSPNGTQEEPLNLSIFANRKPVVVYDTNGIPMEGYKCAVCPQIFQDLNDLKEHEYVNNHRAPIPKSESPAVNFLDSRPCDSPPMEAMNLSVKVMKSSKKSSQNNSKVSNNTGNRSGSNKQTTTTTLVNSAPIPISSPSSLSSVDTAISNSAVAPGMSSPKAEKEFIYLCDECPARFFFEKELKIHHTFHENKSIFQCPKCSYSARQKDPHLMSHMRVHGTAYQEKTKALLNKFPMGGKVKSNGLSGSTSSLPGTATQSATSAAAAAYQAAALSAASLFNLNLLNPNFNLQTAAAALSSVAGKNAMAGLAPAFSAPDARTLDTLRKNGGLSIPCPKCPEKFFNPQAFQQHIQQHSNGRGGTEYRCRFCDYWAESRKALAVHEVVHSTSDISGMGIDPQVAKLLSSSVASAFNPVSMMAVVAHQDSPFTPISKIGNGRSGVEAASNIGSGEQDGHGNAEKSTGPVPEEAYEGNPDFLYPTYMKNGRVKSKRYKCLRCPSAFEKRDQYFTHVGLHGSNQKYKCTVCDYAVTYYANYIQHLKKHENQRDIPTELLNLGRKRHQDEDGGNGLHLKLAKIAENGENSSSSSISANSNGSSFDSNSENHHHQNQNDGIRAENLIGALMKCNSCPFSSFDQTTFDEHVIHHQSNPNWLHVCNICTFRTSSKKFLKEHSKLHVLNGFHHLQAQQLQKLSPEIMMNGSVAGVELGKSKTEDGSKGEYLNGYNVREDIEDISSDGSV